MNHDLQAGFGLRDIRSAEPVRVSRFATGAEASTDALPAVGCGVAVALARQSAS